MTSIKKALLGTTVLFGVAALSGAASADVFVTANITKDHDKRVFEFIHKDVDVDIVVVSRTDPDQAAQSESLVNQRNEDNYLEHDGSGDESDRIDLEANIRGSISDNEGITQVNQDVGNMTNQGNVLSVSIISSGESFADANASAEQQTNNNTVYEEGQTLVVSDPQREANIRSSINDNTGVTQVNQNAGGMNSQLNAVSLAVGDEEALVALSEADLGQFNTNNHVDSFVTVKAGRIIDSVNNNAGITNVNQSTGNMNNQGTVISVSGIGVGG